MTEDNWNVKNKCVVYASSYQPSSGDINMIKFNDHEKILEILRQKLVEDVEEYDYFSPVNFKKAIKDIINKRFGVE